MIPPKGKALLCLDLSQTLALRSFAILSPQRVNLLNRNVDKFLWLRWRVLYTQR